MDGQDNAAVSDDSIGNWMDERNPAPGVSGHNGQNHQAVGYRRQIPGQ